MRRDDKKACALKTGCCTGVNVPITSVRSASWLAQSKLELAVLISELHDNQLADPILILGIARNLVHFRLRR
jgi:hypothetical protein